VLLASSITPSGAVWAESAARKAISTAHVVDLGDFSDHPLVAEFSESFRVTGASRVSGDLSGAMASVRRTAMLLAAFDVANSRVDPTVVVVEGSVPELVSDACSFSALLQVSAAETPLAQRAKTMSDALAGGDVEWIVVTPPERAAMDSVTVQVAQGCALGLRVTGVVVAPMPRKRDGWPNKIRRSARGLVEQLQDRLFDIPVQRSRAGKVPVLPSRAARGIELRGAGPMSVTISPESASLSQLSSGSESEGGHVLSVTIPGLQYCDVEVGVWSQDPSYPSTHIVVRLDGVIARIELDSTLRRCVAVEAVVAGDSIAVSFRADPAQWPEPRASSSASDQADEQADEREREA
jgi:hypothetical protein